MKVISISLDASVIDPHSLASVRNRTYGDAIDRYVVVVPHNMTVIRELGDRVSVYGVGGGSKCTQFFNIARVLNRLIREEKFDVISTSDPYFLGVLAYLFAQWYRCGLEVHLSGIEKLTILRQHIGMFVVRRAGSVRVNSMRLKETLSSLWKVAPEHIHYVPILILHDHLVTRVYTRGSDEGQRQHAFEDTFDRAYRGRFNILTVTPLTHIKNVPLLLSAVKALVPAHPEVKVHIVGDGPERQSIAFLIENLGISDHVILHGNIDRVLLGSLYRKADCFVLPSRSEGWTLSVIEAMATGIPVIMTNVGFAGEVIKHNVNGLVVPVDDAPALTRALETLITDEALRRKVSNAARAYFDQYWATDRIVAGYRESWHNALANK